MHIIQHKNTTIELPEKWEELTEKQVLYLASLWPLVPTAEKMLQVLFFFLNLKKNIRFSLHLGWQYLKSVFYGVPEQFTEQLDIMLAQMKHFDWLFFKNELNMVIYVKHGNRRYKGCTSKLENLCAYEFAVADGSYVQFMKTNEEKYLDMLIAAIWRVVDNKGVKSVFDEAMLEPNLEIVKTWSKQQKYCCLLSYIGHRNQLIDSPIGNKIFSGGDNKGASKGKGWGYIILEMSGEKFGTHQQTKLTPLHDLLRELVAIAEKNSKLTKPK